MRKIIITKNGRELTYEDGKLISNKSASSENNKCLLCNNQATCSRIYEGKFVQICEDCYYNKTLGDIAKAVRNQNAEQ